MATPSPTHPPTLMVLGLGTGGGAVVGVELGGEEVWLGSVESGVCCAVVLVMFLGTK